MKATRWCTGSLLLILAASILSVPASNAWAATEYFFIPTASTTKNDGNDAGVIVPFLITNPEGELRYIVTPMMINNSIVGARGTINVFRYDTGGREMRFIASISEKIERKVLFTYTDPALINGRYAFTVGAAFFKNATSRFFGIGPDTTEGDQTNYTAREGRAEWKFGVYLNEVTQLAIGQRFREVELQPGATDLPFTGNVFPTVPGVGGATILGNRITFHYDTRDNLVTPTDGSQVTAYAELNNNFQNKDHPVYYRYAIDLKKLFPNESKRMILVIRANMQLTFGDQVPFYEQSSLGGQNNLRGYGVDRFIDDNLVGLNIEERIHVMRARIFNVRADFEVAPFVDMGKVFSSFNAFDLNDLKITPGIGFRGIIRPNVVGRVDYGYSNEGGAVFAGLDFPF